MANYPCSICKQPTDYTGKLPALYPFCSDRCQLIDLGRWFNEQYTIDRDLTPDDVAARSGVVERHHDRQHHSAVAGDPSVE